MTRTVNHEEVMAVRALPAPERYEYFIKWVADAEQLWGLRSDQGWVVASDEAGREIFPVWSDSIYAEACREEPWGDSLPTAISLEEWRTKWLPGLKRDGRRVAVFPIRGGEVGVVVDADRLRLDLEAVESELY